MPFALIIIGLLLIVSGARGTYGQLKDLLVKDFTGQHNFMQWIVAIGGVGCLGYIPAFEKFSRVFLVLILISIFLAEKGFFQKFQSALGGVQNSSSSPVGSATNTVNSALTSVNDAVSSAQGTISSGLQTLDNLKSLGNFFGD